MLELPGSFHGILQQQRVCTQFLQSTICPVTRTQVRPLQLAVGRTPICKQTVPLWKWKQCSKEEICLHTKQMHSQVSGSRLQLCKHQLLKERNDCRVGILMPHVDKLSFRWPALHRPLLSTTKCRWSSAPEITKESEPITWSDWHESSRSECNRSQH
ncbi:MAG: hypothetical protein [Circoviridae sp.]|nr:MAG: hypothetical protein [Circoviridae sp.]